MISEIALKKGHCDTRHYAQQGTEIPSAFLLLGYPPTTSKMTSTHPATMLAQRKREQNGPGVCALFWLVIFFPFALHFFYYLPHLAARQNNGQSGSGRATRQRSIFALHDKCEAETRRNLPWLKRVVLITLRWHEPSSYPHIPLPASLPLQRTSD